MPERLAAVTALGFMPTREASAALLGFARSQTAEVVIDAIVNPSSDIAHGFEGAQLTLHDGTVAQGRLLNTGAPLIVQSIGGLTQRIPAAKIRSQQRFTRSLMLSAGQLGLSAQDVADIAAYLKTR